MYTCKAPFHWLVKEPADFIRQGLMFLSEFRNKRLRNKCDENPGLPGELQMFWFLWHLKS